MRHRFEYFYAAKLVDAAFPGWIEDDFDRRVKEYARHARIAPPAHTSVQPQHRHVSPIPGGRKFCCVVYELNWVGPGPEITVCVSPVYNYECVLSAVRKAGEYPGARLRMNRETLEYVRRLMGSIYYSSSFSISSQEIVHGVPILIDAQIADRAIEITRPSDPL